MNTTPEVWKPIPKLHGRYEASNHGQIRSLDVIVTDVLGRTRRVRGRVLKPQVHKSGYIRVVISFPDEQLLQSVHRLVLEAFIGPCPDGMEGCHNNGVPGDNRISNLRWDTLSSNCKDAVFHGTNHNAAKVLCDSGHEFSDDNTYIRPDGDRSCKTCRTESARRYQQRNIGMLREKGREYQARKRAKMRRTDPDGPV